MDYINAFWVGGLICALAQILMEKSDKIIFYVVIVIGILMILLQNGGKKKQKRSE